MTDRLRRLWWTLFDRRLDDMDRVGLPTAIMVSYRRLWGIGVTRLDCGCSRRWWTGRIVLYAWRCPKDHGGFKAMLEEIDHN